MAVDGGPDDRGADAFGDALHRLVAEAAAAEAARERAQERHLREVASAEATFVGLAVDLAERAVTAVVRTVSGRTHRGQILAVGRDFVLVRDGGRSSVLLPLRGITSFRAHPPRAGGSGDTAGDRPAPLDVSFVGLLSRLGAERPRVQAVVAGDDPMTGVVRAVGTDVATLRLDGEDRPTVHLRLAAILEVVLLDL